jgi:hypothetical protein
MIEQGFYIIFLRFATNTQTTLTFDLDLDIDLAKRCLSCVSIIILSIINRDWPVLFIWMFKVSEQIWPLWPWPSRYQKTKKKQSGKCSPLPTYHISFKYLQPFLRNRGVTKLILDKEEKFLLASALSAIFKLNQNKQTKKQSVKSSPLPTYQVSLKYLRPFLRNRCVTHARTRVKIISCHSFAWQLNETTSNLTDHPARSFVPRTRFPGNLVKERSEQLKNVKPVDYDGQVSTAHITQYRSSLTFYWSCYNL